MKLWLRITITITALSVIAASLIAFFVNSKIKQNLEIADSDWSITLSKSISQSILSYTIEGNESKTQEILRRIIKNNHDIEYILVIGFSNELFSSTLGTSKLPTVLSNIDHPNCTFSNEIHMGEHNHDTDEKKDDHIMYEYDGNKVADHSYELVKNLGGHIHIGLRNSVLIPLPSDLAVPECFLV